MGFEYIYAYLENLQWFFIVGTGLCVVGVAALILGRITNEIDKDDWLIMMGAASLALLLFVIVDLSPSMEHIQKVRTNVTKPYLEVSTMSETINREEKNEMQSVFYPSARCTNSLVCSQR